MTPHVTLRARRAEMESMSDGELREWDAYLRIERVDDMVAACLRHSTREDIRYVLADRQYYRARRVRAALRGMPDPIAEARSDIV